MTDHPDDTAVPDLLDDLLDGLDCEWHDEFRVTGMRYRTAAGERTESSGIFRTAGDVSEADALYMVRRIQDARGGTIQRRRVIESEWEDA